MPDESKEIMPEYLKMAVGPAQAAGEAVRTTVSEILLAVERDGIDAVRRYSDRFDHWNPTSFR